MARALDAGSGNAFTCRTSELRGKETDPQPDRVGFKQVMSSLGDVEEALAICGKRTRDNQDDAYAQRLA